LSAEGADGISVSEHRNQAAMRTAPSNPTVETGNYEGLVPVRGYAKGGDAENVEFVGIAA